MYQSSFRTNHSIDFFSGSSDRIYLNGKDKKMDTRMILVHLWRAFDTLEHGLSLKKLNILVSGHLQLYLKIFVLY